MPHAGMLAVLSTSEFDGLAYGVAKGLGEGNPTIVHGTLIEAARMMEMARTSPKYVLMDLGNRRDSALEEIDALAQQCEPGTIVVAVGFINDIQFYRLLTERGVPDYLPLPASVEEVLAAFKRQIKVTSESGSQNPRKAQGELGEVYGFMSAAGGDGASTTALNVAYALAVQSGKPTILVDMDYQFGMAARNLNISAQYGIKDLFDHPERGIDSVFIERMVSAYGPLHVISAPTDLRFLPDIEASAIAELIRTLRQSYSYVVLDLPHVWKPWVAAACRETTTFVIVAQLWLKSVSHAARILRACRDENAISSTVRLVINRSGAKFKEAIEMRDFERVAGLSISHTLANDIKTVVDAEGQAKTIIELNQSTRLKIDLENLARLLKGDALITPEPAKEARPGLQSLFKLKP